MIETGGQPRLADEALLERRLLTEVGREQLQRDGALQLEMARAVDVLMPPCPIISSRRYPANSSPIFGIHEVDIAPV